MDDIFAIQEEIAMQIVDNLKVSLLDQEKEKIFKRHTSNQEAYNLYLKGRYFWNRRYEGGLQMGLVHFQKAIEADPLFAPAYVGIADCYNLLGVYGFAPPIQTFAQSKKAIHKTLEIDDSLSEAYASLGMIQLWFDWDLKGAEKTFKRAIKLNPNYNFAHEWYALYLVMTGQCEKAYEEIKKALELDPLELITNALAGAILYLSRLYDEALQHFNKTIEMDPNFPIVYLFQGATYFSMESWEESVAAYKKLVAFTDNSIISLGNLGTAYAKASNKNLALQYLNKMEKLSQQRYVSPYYQALIYMGLGDFDRAFELLEEAFSKKEPWLICFKQMPFIDSLRSDARFDMLLKNVGLK